MGMYQGSEFRSQLLWLVVATDCKGGCDGCLGRVAYSALICGAALNQKLCTSHTPLKALHRFT